MAQGNVLFHDGFGQYADIYDLERRVTAISQGYGTIRCELAAGPRAGCKVVKGNSTDTVAGIIQAANPSTPSQGIVWGRFKILVMESTNYSMLMGVREVSTYHIVLVQAADGSMTVRRVDVNGTVVAAAPAGTLTLGQWYFIEMKFTIHDTTGSVELAVNEVVVASETGLDTRNGLTGVWTNAAWYSPASPPRTEFTDVGMADGDVFFGDTQSDYHAMTGDGTCQWTPSSGSDRYAMVDDVPQDGDTSYNASSTIGQKDRFTHENLKTPNSYIVAVTPVWITKKSVAGSSLIRPLWIHDGVDYPLANLAPSSESYRHVSDVPMMVNPGTGVQMIAADFNADLVGYEKTA